MPNKQMPPSRRASDTALVVGLFWLLVAIYMLTYVGAFKSGDERLMFCSLDSWVKRGDLTVNQVYWTQTGRLRSDGDIVGYYEPGQMIAAVPAYLWGRALNASVQGAFFLNILVTAACGALLFLIARKLGYGRKVALITTVLYGVATPAWVYSRYFFREPLATLGGLLAFYALLHCEQRRKWLCLALACLGAGLAIVTKLTSAGILPALILLAFSHGVFSRRIGHRRNIGKVVTPVLLVMAVLALVAGLYKFYAVEGIPLLQRLTTHVPAMLSAISAPREMLFAALGLIISPYKGLFVYAPILLLGAMTYRTFWRRHPKEAKSIALLLGVYLIGYVLYPIWWGGTGWGPRFLIPIVPFLMLNALPWMERTVHITSRFKESSRREVILVAGTIILCGLSAIIQIIGVSVDTRISERQLIDKTVESLNTSDLTQGIEALTFDWNDSPIMGQARLLLQSDAVLDFAWVQERPNAKPEVLWVALTLSLLWLALILGGIALLWRRPKWATALGIMAPLCFLGIASLQLTQYRSGDMRFDPYNLEWAVAPAIEYLNENALADDILIVNPAPEVDYFLNHIRAPIKWYGLSEKDYPLPRETQVQMNRILAQDQRIWFFRDRRAEDDLHRGMEHFLVEQGYKIDELHFENWSRLMLFLPPLGEVVLEQTPKTQCDYVRLHSYSVRAEVNRAVEEAMEVSRNTALELALHWQGTKSMTTDYTVFVQLLDENNQIAWQKDRFPGDGIFPTTQWSPGKVIPDNYAVALDLTPGQYRLIAGMYDLTTMDRLIWSRGRDAITLANITVRNVSEESSDSILLSLHEEEPPMYKEFLPLVLRQITP